MIALEIAINGKRLVLAGVDDWEMLSAMIVLQRAGSAEEIKEFSIDIGGLPVQMEAGKLEHLRWGQFDLALGDAITLRAVTVDSAEPPRKRYRSDRSVQESPYTDEEIETMNRAEYERLRAKYGPSNS
jgi:hypothetical protein